MKLRKLTVQSSSRTIKGCSICLKTLADFKFWQYLSVGVTFLHRTVASSIQQIIEQEEKRVQRKSWVQLYVSSNPRLESIIITEGLNMLSQGILRRIYASLFIIPTRQLTGFRKNPSEVPIC